MLLHFKRRKVYKFIAALLSFCIFLSTCSITAFAYTSSAGEGASGFLYDFDAGVQIYENAKSLTVNVDIIKQTGAENGVLIVSLYDKSDTSNKEIAVFVKSDTLNTAHPSGTLSYADESTGISVVSPENMIVKVAIWDSLDKIRPLSVCKTYGRSDFALPETTISTLPATDVGLTTAVIHGQAGGNIAGAGSYAFLYAQAEPEGDEDSIFELVGKVKAGDMPEEAIKEADTITGDVFSAGLTGLKQGKTYEYVAMTGDGETMGTILSFTTSSNFPVVITKSASPIAGRGIAYAAGAVADNKGYAVRECGFLYGTDPGDLNLKDMIYNSISGNPPPADFGGYIGNALKPGAIYYYRAYAINSQGTGYGAIGSFAMPQTAPVITGTPAVFNQGNWTLTMTANIASDGGSGLKYGFRYKYNNSDWIYLPVGDGAFEGSFSRQLSGLEELPPGDYRIECYAANDMGMSTGYCASFSTPYPPGILASLDPTSVRTSSATLKGTVMTANRSDVTERGFEFKLAAEDKWYEAGTEAGTFGTGAYSFTLEGLDPSASYVFRAKAKNGAGWSYSNEITFNTLYSDDARENALKMKTAGHSAVEIANVLKANLGKTEGEACDALWFAGFGASEIAAALKGSGYRSTYPAVITGLKSVGYGVTEVAAALKNNYANEIKYMKNPYVAIDMEVGMSIILLDKGGYTLDEVIRALKEVLGLNLQQIQTALHDRYSNVNDVNAAYCRVYGAEGLAAAYWQIYNGASNPSPAVSQITPILKSAASLGAADNARVLKGLYPDISASILSTAFRDHYPAADTGGALRSVLGLDASAAAVALKAKYAVKAVEDWVLTNEDVSAPQVVEIFTALAASDADPVTAVPEVLKQKFGITAALDAAKVIYAGGWTENANGYYNLDRLVSVLAQSFGVSTAGGVIGILKELGLSPLRVALQMDKSGTQSSLHIQGDWQSIWLKAYKDQGYSSVDTASWFIAAHSQSNIYQVIFRLVDDAQYSLTDTAIALKTVYGLDAAAARQKLMDLDWKYHWSASVTTAINNVYNMDITRTVITQMKASGASATQIAAALMESFSLSGIDAVAAYLIELGYDEEEVLTALARSYLGYRDSSGYHAYTDSDRIRMIAQVMKNTFEQEAADNIGILIGSYGAASGRDIPAREAGYILKQGGFTINDTVGALKNYYGLSMLEAYDLIRGSYAIPDIVGALEAVYGAGFILTNVLAWKEDNIEARYAAEHLKSEYAIADPVAAATYLKAAEYEMKDILVGIRQYYGASTIQGTMQILEQVMETVFGRTANYTGMIAYAYGYGSTPQAVNDFLLDAGYSDEMIAQTLKDEFGLTSTQTLEIMFYQRATYARAASTLIEVSLAVRTVYGGDVAKDYVAYIKSKGGDIYECYGYLTGWFGITDIAAISVCLRAVGYSDDEILDGMERYKAYHAVSVLKALYPADGPRDIVSRIKASAVASHYGPEEIGPALIREYPTLGYADAAILIKEAGYERKHIYFWLSDDHPNKGDPRAEALAKVLGSSGDGSRIGIEGYEAGLLLKYMGYSGVEAVPLLLYDGQYDHNATFRTICIDFTPSGYSGWNQYRPALLICRDAGYTLDQLAAALRDVYSSGAGGGDYGPYPLFLDLADLGYSLPVLTDAMVKGGLEPYKMYSVLIHYADDRRRIDSGRVFPYLNAGTFANNAPIPAGGLTYYTIVDMIYDAVNALPADQKAGIDLVLEIARGLKYLGQGDGWTFTPMIYVAGKVGNLSGLSDEDHEVAMEWIKVVNDLLVDGGGGLPVDASALQWTLALNAMRNAGYTSGEMTYMLKHGGTSFLSNYFLQVSGGYSGSEAWSNIMSCDAYRNQFGNLVLGTMSFAIKPKALTAIYRLVRFFVDYPDLLGRTCALL